MKFGVNEELWMVFKVRYSEKDNSDSWRIIFGVYVCVSVGRDGRLYSIIGKLVRESLNMHTGYCNIASFGKCNCYPVT